MRASPLSPAPLPAHSSFRVLAGSAARRRFGIGLSLRLLVCLLVAAVPVRATDADRMRAAAQQIGPQAVAGLRSLEALLAAAAELDDEHKLVSVNDFFNRRIRFGADVEVWGQEDYWASPLELLGKGEGDCEDFAIAKYFSLVALGVPSARLRLVYVLARVAGSPPRTQAHMVVAHYPAADAEPAILDNLVPDVLAASRRADLTPVFSFNSDGLWRGVGVQPAGDPIARLSPWREVLVKARSEGFL